ncbi:hypothetical protein Salat_0871500 [Sesamum alatum]|uniref:Uncharacterized protein n=1 Tax=Sesamum alatum TaxID=300844 RepID=A0AAE1YIY4_9LAMI|nr:hypothetical protein Salat_0871500 [Sesamum alatum]
MDSPLLSPSSSPRNPLHGGPTLDGVVADELDSGDGEKIRKAFDFAEFAALAGCILDSGNDQSFDELASLMPRWVRKFGDTRQPSELGKDGTVPSLGRLTPNPNPNPEPGVYAMALEPAPSALVDEQPGPQSESAQTAGPALGPATPDDLYLGTLSSPMTCGGQVPAGAPA